MTIYDAHHLKRGIDGLTDPVPNTTVRGRRLQDLAEYLLDKIDGVAVIYRNKQNSAHSEEKDLWIRHQPHVSLLPFNDLILPVECKNEAEPASASELRDFETKVRDSGGCDGLFIARQGLAGKAGTSAHHTITVALSHGVKLTVLVGTDLERLSTPSDLVAILVKRHIELRVEQGYRTI